MEPEAAQALNRSLTGELGEWKSLLIDSPPEPPSNLPRPPPWTRIRKADIERMNRYRNGAPPAD
jgi:hypothetical protein